MPCVMTLVSLLTRMLIGPSILLVHDGPANAPLSDCISTGCVEDLRRFPSAQEKSPTGFGGGITSESLHDAATASRTRARRHRLRLPHYALSPRHAALDQAHGQSAP